ncbi:MAG: hypothetical protein IPF52_19710 [Saprospiraceae bacterium]|nr:hypothetical protein [Saprospiraceae bacterium]
MGPSKSMAGLSLTTTDKSPFVTQPTELVNLRDATPGETGVTVPVGVTVAIVGCNEDHVPPDEGCTLVCCPVQRLLGPSKLVVVTAFTSNNCDVSETQFVIACVKIKRVVPSLHL